MIETERLALRRFSAADGPALHAFLSDPEVVRFEPYPPLDAAACDREAASRAGEDAFWAVCLRAGGELIGNLYLAKAEFEARELGYVFGRAHWGHGYAAEAVRALLDAAFAEGTHRVFAQCNPENAASWRLLERLGMRREAHFLRNVYFTADPAPQWQDTYVYAILQDEWRDAGC